MAGIGIAIGGLIGPRIAAPAVLAITLITWLTDLVGGDLGIPDAIHSLALSTHMGSRWSVSGTRSASWPAWDWPWPAWRSAPGAARRDLKG